MLNWKAFKYLSFPITASVLLILYFYKYGEFDEFHNGWKPNNFGGKGKGPSGSIISETKLWQFWEYRKSHYDSGKTQQEVSLRTTEQPYSDENTIKIQNETVEHEAKPKPNPKPKPKLNATLLPVSQSPKTNYPNFDSAGTQLRNATILIWSPTAFKEKECMKGCPDYNCTITYDKSLAPVADAIVFHARSYSWSTIPEARAPWQRFVFMLMESPHHTSIYTGIRNLDKIRGFFNWTMTYRLDSDVPNPLGYLDFYQPRNDPIFGMSNEAELNPKYDLMKLKKLIEGKTKPIVWFVSNCKTPSQRERYIRQLNQHIRVDIYGGCGMKNCTRSMTKQCDQLIEDEYHFYFAGENSICEDYITEKVWARLAKWSIPILMRREIYKNHLPMSSFIAMDDFATPKEMAEKLKHLMENQSEYLKYFDWRRDHPPLLKFQWRENRAVGYCKLCEMLHDPSYPPKAYYDLYWWWNTQAKCSSTKSIWPK